MTALLNTQDSALDLIKLILKRRADSHVDGVVLTIQKQLVDKRMKLKHTDAAQELRRKVDKLLKESGSNSSQERKEHLKNLAAKAAELRLSLSTRFLCLS
ncbi:hypothetical protein EST38_g12641 [Candolleomyces aberdarensis]|uniref:Uncharacterized protein n=1 Tax=Candolleomyces aberdarensis TaxID=2316362 RepID=A0A4Q2D1Y1_9AGAR|nr:hypothetical protein EST38_g12641 [Candolleomyces aberdarensis]